MEEKIKQACAEAIKNLFNHTVDPKSVGIERTKKEIRGDYTVVVFPFVRFARMSPEQTATQIGTYLKEQLPEIESFEVIKGFLNLILSDTYWTGFLGENIDEPSFGKHPERKTGPIVLEYSSPNTNKPLHLGHIRNNLLGYAISLILEANGYPVKKVNLVNDRGIHICKSMVAYMKWGEGETPESAGMKGDHLVGKYYVMFDQNYRKEVRELIDKGMNEDDAAAQADLLKEAQDLLRQWENRDPDILDLWETMNQWAYDGFDETYLRLGVNFDKVYHESDTYLLGKELVMEGLEQGVLFRKPNGSVWIDLRDDGLDEKLLLRADGTSVYMTQDLGTAMLRYDEFHPEQMIYVVGNEQIYHFEVLKLVLEKLGKPAGRLIYHLSYGMVELPAGKMKSREGTVVDADDLMGEMVQTAESLTRELGKADELDQGEAEALFEMIGLGALKYFILKVDPKKNMLFNPEESIDFNGNTGPFIQYTHARIQSLLRKADFNPSRVALGASHIPNLNSYKLNPIERDIIKLLCHYPNIVRQAGEELSPALVANYIFDLAKEYNQFYQEIPVLREDNEEIRTFRLMLSYMTGKIIREGMGLLGIQVPNRM